MYKRVSTEYSNVKELVSTEYRKTFMYNGIHRVWYLDEKQDYFKFE